MKKVTKALLKEYGFASFEEYYDWCEDMEGGSMKHNPKNPNKFLWTDGDSGVAEFDLDCEIYESEGIGITLIDCTYCDFTRKVLRYILRQEMV